MKLIDNLIRKYRIKFTLNGRITARQRQANGRILAKDSRVQQYMPQIDQLVTYVSYSPDRWVNYIGRGTPGVLCSIVVMSHPLLTAKNLRLCSIDLVYDSKLYQQPPLDAITVKVSSLGRTHAVQEEMNLQEALLGDGLYLCGLVDRAMRTEE